MIIIIAAATCWVLWVLYIAVMALKRVREAGKLTLSMKVLGYPLLYTGLALDIFVNVVVCTVLLLEFPEEILVTGRLARHKYSDDESGIGRWRRGCAAFICEQLLDSLDPSGCHCNQSDATK